MPGRALGVYGVCMSTRPPKAGGRATIVDVAAAAGVSRGTVSRVLNGGHYVSAGAAEAVREAIRTTGFVANLSARDLVSRRSRMIAVVIDRAPVRLSSDSNTAALLLAFRSLVAESGYSLTTLFVDSPEDDAAGAELLRGRPVDGALVLSDESSPRILEALAETAVPVVFACAPGGVASVTVSIDDEHAAFDVSRTLAEAGRRRVGMIAVALDRRYGRARLEGFTAAMGDDFDPRLVVKATDCTFEAGERAALELLDAHPDLDGLFAASDAVAAGAIRALQERGRAVPGDIGVVGFDGNEWAERCSPHLTTVKQPMAEMGQAAARTLLDLLSGVPAGSVVIRSEVVLRHSA